jgi:hypothetical protein
LTEQMSGKLPIERPAPADLSDRAAVMRLAADVAAAFAQVSEAATRLTEALAAFNEIGARLEPLRKQIGEISDGAGDHGAVAG